MREPGILARIMIADTVVLVVAAIVMALAWHPLAGACLLPSIALTVLGVRWLW